MIHDVKTDTVHFETLILKEVLFLVKTDKNNISFVQMHYPASV